MTLSTDLESLLQKTQESTNRKGGSGMTDHIRIRDITRLNRDIRDVYDRLNKGATCEAEPLKALINTMVTFTLALTQPINKEGLIEDR